VGLLLGAFHEPLAGRVDPLAGRVGVLPFRYRPALADVLVEGLCDGEGRASAAFRGVFCRGARVGSRAASPHVATWGFRIAAFGARRRRACVNQCCGLAASASARAGPETELTLKKDLGRGRRQRKRSNESSCDHFVYVGQRRRRKTVQQRRLRGDTWSLSGLGLDRPRCLRSGPRVQNHETPTTRRKSAPVGADLTKPGLEPPTSQPRALLWTSRYQ
jgi:hypothetical protein